MRIKIITFILILTVFLVNSLVSAEETGFVKGKLISVDQQTKTIVIRDKNGVDTTIIFEDEEAFSRIEKLRIKIGEKVSVKYTIKENKKIGKYIRSLRGC